MVSVRKETYKLFGRTAPEPFLQPREGTSGSDVPTWSGLAIRASLRDDVAQCLLAGKRTIWNYQCGHGQPNEMETGQLVLDKARAWKGLYMVRCCAWSCFIDCKTGVGGRCIGSTTITAFFSNGCSMATR